MSDLARRRLLIVDDDETLRTALVRAFQRRNFDVVEAESVAAALELSRSAPPDYASIDLRMPGASGLELVRRLALHVPRPVLVVLTGYGSIATAVEAVKLGAAHYLTKPADANDLLRAFGLLEPPAGKQPVLPEVPSLARVEWEHISRVVTECGGNISMAARLLGMQRRSLQRKLAKYPVSR
jgi:two-component system, response regulator RegA